MENFNYVAPPTISKFMRSDAGLRVLVGPIASGKTIGCFAEIIRRCTEATIVGNTRLSKWVIVCQNVSTLKASIVHQWLETFGQFGFFDRAKTVFSFRFNGAAAEISFISLDNQESIRRLLRSEITGAFVHGPISPNMLYDILARVGRYPPMRDGGPKWYGVICELNRPDEGTPEYALAHHLPQEDGHVIPAKVFWQPSALSAYAENLDNLPSGYYERLASGQSKAWVRKYLECSYST